MQPEVTYDPIKPQEAEVLYGACIMIRHEILETVGLKDENLVHGWDEYDWCKRISNHGWKLYYTPDSELIHYRGATRKKADGLKVNLHKYHLEGLFYLYKKHYGISKYILLKIIWYIKNIFIFPFFITRKIFNA
jgi:GT2 family glycosyltransferase